MVFDGWMWGAIGKRENRHIINVEWLRSIFFVFTLPSQSVLTTRRQSLFAGEWWVMFTGREVIVGNLEYFNGLYYNLLRKVIAWWTLCCGEFWRSNGNVLNLVSRLVYFINCVDQVLCIHIRYIRYLRLYTLCKSFLYFCI